MAEETLTLEEQFTRLHESVTALAESVDRWERSTRRSRALVIAVSVVSVIVLALVLFVGWFAWTTRNDITTFGERLFLSSCEANNDARSDQRLSNVQEAEALIAITGADVTDPDLSGRYRDLTEEINSRLPDRDCRAELDTAR